MIGGITGPFIGLISAVLVYLTLWAQIKANSIINKQIKEDKNAQIENEIKTHSILLLSKIESYFENFELKDSNKTITGAEAIRKLLHYYFFDQWNSSDEETSFDPSSLKNNYDLYINLQLLAEISQEIIEVVYKKHNQRELFLYFSREFK